MLELAMIHETELNKKLMKTMMDPKFKYYYNYSWREQQKLETSTWSKMQFVSIHKGEILGFLTYSVDRSTSVVTGLSIMNFGEMNLIFSRDLHKFLRDIFEASNFRKLRFGVVIGNPIEKAYDKMIEQYGGRIIGYFEKDDMLMDGTLVDYKTYEIMRENYFAHKIMHGTTRMQNRMNQREDRLV